MRFPKSWGVIPTAWILEKTSGFLFYWILFGYILHKFGTATGILMLVMIQCILSTGFIWVYDIFEKDIFGIATLKAKFSPQFHENVDTHPFHKGLVMVTSFSLVAWQCVPPVVVLCFRHGDDQREHGRDLKVLSGAIAFSTIYWTLFHRGILNYVWKAFGE